MDDMPDNILFKFHEEKTEAGLCAQKKESLGLVVQTAERLSSVKALCYIFYTFSSLCER